MNPKISVVMPSYNQAQFLETSITSVLGQNYSNLEFILMDGGSTDDSVDIIEKYSDKVSYWQSEPDGGQSAAINAGMKRATGDILCWLNSDDLFFPGALKFVGEYFQQNPDCMWLVGKGEFHSQGGRHLQHFPARNLTAEGILDWGVNHFEQPSVFWRRELWETVGGLDENNHLCMDYDLWLKFVKLTPAHKVDDQLSITIIHDDRKSCAMTAESYAERCIVQYNNGYRKEALARLGKEIHRTFWVYRMLSPVLGSGWYKRWRGY